VSRRLIAAVAGLALLAAPAPCQDRTPVLYRAAQYAFVICDGIDFGVSYAAIMSGQYSEENKALAWIYKTPAVGVAMTLALDGLFIIASSAAYRHSKPLGWAVVGAMILVKSCVLYRNFKTLEGR